MSISLTVELDQRTNKEVLKAFEKLFKKDMEIAVEIMNEGVAQIAEQAKRSTSNIGSGAISDSYSHNWSGSSNQRGEVGGKAKKQYGVQKTRPRKNFPEFLAGSAHPLAHIFELGTKARRTKGTGKVQGGGERVQFKQASRGTISAGNDLNRAFNQVAPGIPEKLRKGFDKVKV